MPRPLRLRGLAERVAPGLVSSSMGLVGSRRLLCSWRARSLALGVLVLVGIPSACGGRTDIEVLEVSVQNEGATLVFQVNTCNEDSTSVSVVESDSKIIVTASTRAGFGCSGGGDSPIPGLFSWTNLSATGRSAMKTDTKSVASIRSSPDCFEPDAGGPVRRNHAVLGSGRSRVASRRRSRVTALALCAPSFSPRVIRMPDLDRVPGRRRRQYSGTAARA